MLILILPLITVPYVSRILGADGIGIYSYTYSIAYYFMLIAMLGLNNYGNRTIAKVRDDPKKLSKEFLDKIITSMNLNASIDIKRENNNLFVDIQRIDTDDKGIIIGKKGSKLKQIGTWAREEIENLLDIQVNLKLWVKVKKDWRDSDILLKNFGFNKQEE